MEGLTALGVIVGLLLALDIAALKWGKNVRQTGWLDGSYDPYYEWHPRNDNGCTQSTSNQAVETGEIIVLWEKTTPCLN